MRGTACQFWAESAESYFGGMTSRYQPEKSDVAIGQKAIRRVLPPLTASGDIIAAIAACAPQLSGSASPVIPPQVKEVVGVG